MRQRKPVPDHPLFLDCGQIQVPKSYMEKVFPLNATELSVLAGYIRSQTFCPAIWWFDDSPEVRKILKLEMTAGGAA